MKYNATETSTGRWQVRLKVQNKQPYGLTFDTKKEAEHTAAKHTVYYHLEKMKEALDSIDVEQEDFFDIGRAIFSAEMAYQEKFETRSDYHEETDPEIWRG